MVAKVWYTEEMVVIGERASVGENLGVETSRSISGNPPRLGLIGATPPSDFGERT